MDKVSDIIEQIMFHVRKNPHNYPKGPKNQRQTNGMMPTAPRLEELNAGMNYLIVVIIVTFVVSFEF